MADNSNNSYYDPPAGHQGQRATDPRKIQEELDEAQNTFKQNMAAMGQRGQRLDELNHKTENLSEQANGFRRGANRVRKQMWWKDMKMRICIIVGIIVLLVIIIVPSVIAAGK